MAKGAALNYDTQEEDFAAYQRQCKIELSNTCYKCNGAGRINAFSHINNGTCFACKGTGKRK